MKKLFTFLLVAISLVLMGNTADAQTFEQSFGSSTTVSDYVNASPSNGQFNAISTSGAGVVLSINTTGSNKLRFARSGANAGAFSRTTDFSGPPTSLMYRFDVTVSGNTVAQTTAASFQVGNAFGTGNSAEANASTYARIGINWTTTTGQFSIRDLTGAVNTANYTGTQTVTWVMNNSGSSLTYKAPDGTFETLANDRVDVWIGTTREFNDINVQTTTQTMTDLKFVLNQGTGTVDIDNILIDPIPGVPTSSAATNITSSGFDANWATVSGANDYRLDVSTSNTFASFVSGYNDLDVSNVLTYSVTGLTPSTQYYYRVRAAGKYTIATFSGNNSSTQSPMTSAGGGATPPTLTAAGGATVDAPFNVTFTPDATWEGLVTGVTIGGTPLTAGYSVGSGTITFTPSASTPAGLLQTSGTKSILVQATGYNDATVSQSIAPGTATHLSVTQQPVDPAVNGSTLATQPIVAILDQYNNTTTSTANVVASVGAGTWSIGGTTTIAGVNGVSAFTNLTATSASSVTGATISFASTGLTGATSGTFNIPAPPTLGLQLSAVDTPYLIDFDNTVSNVNNGQFTGTGFTTSPTSGRLNSEAWEITGMSDGNLSYGGSATAGDFAVGTSTGGVTTGGVYAFTVGTGNNGLGFQPTGSDWAPGTVTLRSQNKTGTTVTSILLSYSIYVRNDQGRSSSFNLSHSSDNATYNPITSVDLTSPVASTGNAWIRYIRVVLITGLSVADNGFSYYRWSSADVGGSGSRDEFVIDDINVIVNPTSSTYPSFTGACQDLSGYGNFGLSGTLTVAGTATIASGTTATLGTNNFTGTGGAATLAGTGTIALSGDLNTQIASYNSNTFATTGRYLFYGNSQVIPSGTYEDLRVQGTGTTLSGDLTVNGDLEMQGTLSVGANTLTISNPISVNPTNLTMDATSSLVINGTAANIHVPSSVTALNNLTYNNSSLVTADANLTISGTFTLGTSGFILDMGANTLEIGTSTANIGAISRIGSGSVRGILKRWTNTATSSLLFPLNNNATDYVGATVNFSVNPSTGGSLTARYTSTGSGLFPLGPNGIDRYIDFGAQHTGMNLVNLSPQFWTISDADGLAGFTYGLSLEANNMGINTSGNNYQYTAVVKRNTGGGNTWAWSNSNHVTTGGNGSNPVPQCQGYTSFSDFAIGGNIDNLLPVELSNLTSAISGRDLILSWSTGTEINNSGFDIERKSTTGGWSKIGNVAGHGTVNTPNSYTYTDRNLSSGKYNYRLKQIDFNGNYKYYELSNEVIIGTPSKYVLTQNFPNPFNPSTSISYEIPATNFVSLKIYDMMGKEVANLVNGTQEAGFYTVKFDASKLASGVYFYKLQANDFTATKKLMLMK